VKGRNEYHWRSQHLEVSGGGGSLSDTILYRAVLPSEWCRRAPDHVYPNIWLLYKLQLLRYGTEMAQKSGVVEESKVESRLETRARCVR
jgi:hypothetical protein